MQFLAPTLGIVDGIEAALIVEWATRIAGVIVVWIVVGFLVRHLSRLLIRFDKETTHIDISQRDLRTIDRLLDYVIVIVGVILTLAIMGWTNLLYSALTAAGVFTIIIGFAVKDVAANFISGIFILVDRPFAPGDFIEVGEQSGTVENVSLRMTTLVTLDGPKVFIPNSVVSVQPTRNFSLAEARRINFSLAVANDTDVGRAIQLIKQVLENEEGLLADRTQLVLVNEVREYAVDISVICYAPTDTFFTLASDLRQQVMVTLQEHDIELAIPTRKNVNVDSSLLQTSSTDEV